MTTSIEPTHDYLLEQSARKSIYNFGFGLYGFKPVGPYREDEPLTLTDGERTIVLETRILDVTGWEHEK